MSVVEDVLRLGDDALSNQYLCTFPSGIPGGGNEDNISLRMNMQFDMPQQILYVYDLDFRGSKIRKTGKKEETQKEFTVSVRIDQMWKNYDDLARWHKMSYDPANNNAMLEVNTRAPIVIQSIDGSNAIQKSFKFTQCKLFGMKVTTFDMSTGDPLYVELTFLYGEFDDGVKA